MFTQHNGGKLSIIFESDTDFHNVLIAARVFFNHCGTCFPQFFFTNSPRLELVFHLLCCLVKFKHGELDLFPSNFHFHSHVCDQYLANLKKRIPRKNSSCSVLFKLLALQGQLVCLTWCLIASKNIKTLFRCHHRKCLT